MTVQEPIMQICKHVTAKVPFGFEFCQLQQVNGALQVACRRPSKTAAIREGGREGERKEQLKL